MIRASGALLLLVAWLLGSPASARAHAELNLYATAAGELVVDGFSSGPAPVDPSVCLGGICLYSGIDPGIVMPAQDQPAVGRFALAPGTRVYLTIDSADPPVRVRYNGAYGTSFELGTAPNHVHPEWTLQLPEGVFGSYALQIRFAADGYNGTPGVSLQVSNLGSAPTPTPTSSPSPTPTSPPTPTPSPAPSPGPSAATPVTATPRPSSSPPSTATPSQRPTPSPVRTPPPVATLTPRPTPSLWQTPVPSGSVVPTPKRTLTPTGTPTAVVSPPPGETPAASATPPGSSAPAGVRPGLDGGTVLVNKDVGDERWAITWSADGAVTGNVFFADGRPPAFVFCEETAALDASLRFACYGADRCPVAPCDPDDWSFIAEVELPRDFFEPPPRRGEPPRSGAAQAGRPGAEGRQWLVRPSR